MPECAVVRPHAGPGQPQPSVIRQTSQNAKGALMFGLKSVTDMDFNTVISCRGIRIER